MTGQTPALNAPVRALLQRPPVTCSPETTIAEASRIMAAERVGSIVVLGGDRAPAGIVTRRDFLERVLAPRRSLEDPVASVMSAPLVTVSPEAFVFEALLEMTRRGLHHLPVVEAHGLVGMISSHDLLLVHASAPLELSRLIQSRRSLAELEADMPELTRAVGHFVEQGLSGYEIGRIVAELNDLVVRRVLAFVEQVLRDENLGEPPVPYCWLALGSEGRREQTLRTDQDNALVYADATADVGAHADRYFTRFAERAISDLVQLGYPRCPADAMASNPRWRKPLSTWRRYFGEWVREPVPQHLLHASIYFDLRPVAGAPELAAALRQEIRTQVGAWRSFPRHLGKLAVSSAVPLGLFGRFRLERQNGARGIDMKLNAMLLLVNALRAYAVELGLEETNTIERLAAATRAGGCFRETEAEDIRGAYETVFHLRLRHQLECLAAGTAPDNFLDPYALGPGAQRRLREALRVIRRLQGRVESRYLTEALL